MTMTNPGNEFEPMNESTQEIALADTYVEVTVPVSSEALIAHIESPESLSLPAALCDDKLIEEINSIPEKMGFKIGEVAEMLAIKQYVLRYWESEFDILKPKKASNNQRYYTKKDVENAYIIRKLLHRDRFSIEGARAALRDLKSFVRTEVKKEKELMTFHQKMEVVQDRIEDFIIDIRKLKRLFN